MSSPVLWYATRASGLTTLGLLTLTTVLGILTSTRVTSRRWPGVAVQDLHRRVSLATAFFVVVHVATSVVDTFVHIGWSAVVVPFASDYKRWWVGLGAISFDAFVAVAATSLLRHRLSARTWRSVHWLTYGAWAAGIAHSLGIGTDMRLSPVRDLALVCVLAVVMAALARAAWSLDQRRHLDALPAVRTRAERGVVKHHVRRPGGIDGVGRVAGVGRFDGAAGVGRVGRAGGTDRHEPAYRVSGR